MKLPQHLIELFEDLSNDNNVLQAKYNCFCAAIHHEQKVLAIRAKEVWTQAIFVLGLEGEWRYENGRVYPVDETLPK